MIEFCLVNSEGRVVQKGVCADNDLSIQQIPSGLTLHQSSCDLGDYLEDGIFKKPVDRPGHDFDFDYVSKQWVAATDRLVHEARLRRNKLLSQSDWTQLPDVPLATKEAWATYRQALRDITDQPGYPLNIVWPEPPT